MAGDDFDQIRFRDPKAADAERDRLIAAFGKAAAEHGYIEVTGERIARYAGLPEGRYEAHFDSKERALIAAQDVFLERLLDDAVAGCGAASEWPGKVCAALSAVLASLVEASTLARVFWVEGTAASFAAAERHFVALERFAAMLRDGRRLYPRAAELPAPTERALIGGIASIVSGHLLAEEPQVLSGIEPELAELVLLPYLGPHEARRVALA